MIINSKLYIKQCIHVVPICLNPPRTYPLISYYQGIDDSFHKVNVFIFSWTMGWTFRPKVTCRFHTQRLPPDSPAAEPQSPFNHLHFSTIAFGEPSEASSFSHCLLHCLADFATKSNWNELKWPTYSCDLCIKVLMCLLWVSRIAIVRLLGVLSAAAVLGLGTITLAV